MAQAASPHHVLANSVCQKPKQALTSIVAHKSYRASVWIRTKEIVQKGSYNPFWNDDETVKIPAIDANCIPYIFSKMPKPAEQRQQQQEEAEERRQKQQQHQKEQEEGEGNDKNRAISISSSEDGAVNNEQQQQQQQQQQVQTKAQATSAAGGCGGERVPQQQQQQTQQVMNKKKLKIRCVRGDCMDIARDLYVRYKSPCMVFDPASAGHFGGGYTSGSRACEEEQCRRTTLAFQMDPALGHQKHDFYPITPKPNARADGIFVPNSTVFRGGVDTQYALLPKPFPCHFAVIAAPNKPTLVNQGREMNAVDASSYLTVVRTAFRMATLNNAKSVVTVSVGSGAFAVPSIHSAALICQAIREECVNTSAPLEEVVISLFDDHNSTKGHPEGNAVVFAQTALAFFGDEIDVVDCDSGEDLKEWYKSNKKISIMTAADVAARLNSSSKGQNHQHQQQQQQYSHKPNNNRVLL